MLYFSGIFGGMGQRQRGGNSSSIFLIGIALMVASFILNLFVFYASRLREYYADSHAAAVSTDGARNLQRALARIMQASGKAKKNKLGTAGQFKMFFIADPDTKIRAVGDVDQIVAGLKAEKPSILREIFSTHPHPARRLRRLDRYLA